MFKLPLIVVMVCGDFEWNRICTGFLPFVLPLGVQLLRGEGFDPINHINLLAYLCQDLATLYLSWYFCLFSKWRWDVVVHLVDIGGIVDRHCLNFLFIMQKMGCWKVIVFCGTADTIFIFTDPALPTRPDKIKRFISDMTILTRELERQFLSYS